MEQLKSIPINLILGEHEGKENLFQLDFMGKQIDSMLSRNPSGRVVVMMEEAYWGVEESGAISIWVNEGMLPSDAYAQLSFFNEKGRLPGKSELRFWKRQHRDPDPFANKELEILDNLATKYPGRIWLAPEWMPHDELREVYEGEYRDLGKNSDRAHGLAIEGNFAEALPIYKDTLLKLSERIRVRDSRLASTIIEEIEDRGDVIFVTGFFGSVHTPIVHILAKEGWNAKYSLPEKKEGDFVHDPLNATLRYLRFFPDKILSEAEWKKSLLLSASYHFISLMNDEMIAQNKDKIGDEQDLTRMIWGVLGDLDSEGVEKMITYSQRHGLPQALEDIVSVLA